MCPERILYAFIVGSKFSKSSLRYAAEKHCQKHTTGGNSEIIARNP